MFRRIKSTQALNFLLTRAPWSAWLAVNLRKKRQMHSSPQLELVFKQCAPAASVAQYLPGRLVCPALSYCEIASPTLAFFWSL